MTPDLQALGIDRMSLDEQIALVTAIWDNIASAARSSPLSDAKQQDLKRRLTDIETNPEAVVAWDEIDAEMKERFQP